MSSLTPPMPRNAPVVSHAFWKVWWMHGLSLLIPFAALAYVWTGPHPWYIAPLFIVPFAIFQWIDVRPHHERRQPVESWPERPFDAWVYVLAAIHFFILLGLVVMFSRQQIFSVDMVMVFVVVGGNSGFSIITAHELIHRRNRLDQSLGRLLLSTVLYEHFFTEHLRGHHVRVGTSADPATARFGERYEAFFRRTVPGQLKSAWRIESRRLGDEEMKIWDRRTLGNRVLHGLLFEWSLVFAVGWFFGPVSALAYVLQAVMAVRLLEAVNYFEHWGLTRRGRRVRPEDSWDTHSWFTYYGLIGLSRHADHHAYPSRPYQQLRVWEEAPVLPIGYVGLVDLVLTRNDEFIEMATQELKAKGLGPFSPEGSGMGLESAVEEKRSDSVPEFWHRVPGSFRPLLLLATLLVGTAIGVAVESGGALSWSTAMLRNGLILAIILAVLFARQRLDSIVENGWVSWGCGFSALVFFGWLSAPWTM
ncbi:MAG: alkane 1-monooxygenase [Myxococcota bacterium]|nr:alkane 1-monooxygenase [Myxococcota bacterium]